jgi:transcriptional regulator
VHAYGTPALLDDWQAVRQLLDDTVTTFESNLPKQWSTSLAGEDYITKLGQAIVAFEIPITSLEGKRKLSQNRASDIQSAAAGLHAHGDATGQIVAEQMLDVARSLR